MKKVISEVIVKDLDSNNNVESLPMVPATGSLTVAVEHGKAGWTETYKLSLTVEKFVQCMTHPLIVKVIYDDGSHVVFGTSELPVRFSVNKDMPITLSTTWSR